MVKKKAMDLKPGDIVIVYGEKSVIKAIETSGKGVKQGKAKCRIEAESLIIKKPVIFIRLAEDLIEVE